jgi:hypothetical protein
MHIGTVPVYKMTLITRRRIDEIIMASVQEASTQGVDGFSQVFHNFFRMLDRKNQLMLMLGC